MDQWEAEGQFPAHKIFKILGNAGFLGVNKPVGKSIRVLIFSIRKNQQEPGISFNKCTLADELARWFASRNNNLQD